MPHEYRSINEPEAVRCWTSGALAKPGPSAEVKRPRSEDRTAPPAEYAARRGQYLQAAASQYSDTYEIAAEQTRLVVGWAGARRRGR